MTTLPKYLSLKKVIKDWALNGELRPGDQIPTEAQLAEQFNMSRQTVRMALNELEHERFLKRYQGRGTFLSEDIFDTPGVETRSHKLIAVVTTYISDYIFPSIIRGIDARLSEDSYSMLLLSTNNDFQKEAQALESILSRPIDGVILEPTKSTHNNPNLHRYLRLLNRNLPLIMLHGSYLELDLPVVRMDDENGGARAVCHLHGLGHRRIGMLANEDDIQGKLRLRGFLRAHTELGIPYNSEWIQLYTAKRREEICSKYVEALRQATSSERPSAVVCYNDEIASDFVKCVQDSGMHIPSDISVLSFDDSQWAQDNDVTSLVHPKFDMGVMAAEKILQALKAGTFEQSNRDFIYDPELVVRSSTGRYS